MWSKDELGEQDLLQVQTSTTLCLHACSQDRYLQQNSMPVLDPVPLYLFISSSRDMADVI